jgi:hypothetical protein
LTLNNDNEGFIGVLMLDTAFPRIVGDAGNIESYNAPARVKVVSGIGSIDVVRDGKLPTDVIKHFCRAAQDLEREGARIIVSTCGFLITAQDEIAQSVNVPVMVSSLSLFGGIKITLGTSSKVGILTASKRSLGKAALNAAGILDSDAVIMGLENYDIFRNIFLCDKYLQPNRLDANALENAVVEQSLRLVESAPDVGALIFECGNLPPYADAVRQSTGRPVFSIIDAANFLWSGTRLR